PCRPPPQRSLRACRASRRGRTGPARPARTRRGPARPLGGLGYFVADGDDAVGEDVRVQAAPVQEALDHAGLRHRLEAGARLAQRDAFALDGTDAEALADERVQVDAAREDVAPRLGRRQLESVLRREALERLRGDQRQRLPRLGAALEVVAVADEPLAR